MHLFEALQQAATKHDRWLENARSGMTLPSGLLEACIRSDFLGHVIAALPRQEHSLGVPARVVFLEGRWTLLHDPEACAHAEWNELADWLLREAWHLVLEHDARRAPEHDPVAWALATDHVAAMGLDDLPDWARPLQTVSSVRDLRDPTAEDVHDALLHEPDASRALTHHLGEGPTCPLKPHSSTTWMAHSARVDLLQEAAADSLAETVPELLHEERDFSSQRQQVLTGVLEFLSSRRGAHRKSAWNRTCRRSGRSPGRERERSSTVAFVLDTSRSMDTMAMEAELDAMRAVLTQFPVDGWILQCDNSVHDVRPLTTKSIDELEFVGRRGTDLQAAFEFVRMHLPSVDAIVYGTDGKGLAPTREERPTLWLVAPGGRQPAPWGATVFLGENREQERGRSPTSPE